MAIKINEEEINALKGLPYTHKILYVFGIRQYMDYKTGIVGIMRGISYQSLREELYVPGHCGSQEMCYPSIQQVRRIVRRLIQTGLISSKSVGQRLIFKCILAETDRSVQKQADRKPTDLPDREEDISVYEKNHLKSITCKKNKTKEDREGDRVMVGQADTPPVSGINTENNNSACVREAHKPVTSFIEHLRSLGFDNPKFWSLSSRKIIGGWATSGVTHEDITVAVEHARATSANIYSINYLTHFVLQAMQIRTSPQPVVLNLKTYGVKDDKQRRQDSRLTKIYEFLATPTVSESEPEEEA